MPRKHKVLMGAGGAGTVLWDGNMSNISGGPWTLEGDTIFLSSPNPYSSWQSLGNTATDYATVSLDSTVNRNSRESKSLKVVMQPFSQRAQGHARNEAPPLQGRWTPDDVGSVDLWYGWSILFGSDFGSNATMEAEMTGTVWLTPGGSFRTTGANGSMNLSADENDSDADGGPVNSTPRTIYLRRNSVLQQLGFYTDGLGLDKLSLGQAVTNQWMDFVVHVRWSSTTTNALREVWRDGVFMGSKTSLNAVDNLEHAFRMGMYQETVINHTRTSWYSNCRIGTSYNAVDPSRTT